MTCISYLKVSEKSPTPQTQKFGPQTFVVCMNDPVDVHWISLDIISPAGIITHPVCICTEKHIHNHRVHKKQAFANYGRNFGMSCNQIIERGHLQSACDWMRIAVSKNRIVTLIQNDKMPLAYRHLLSVIELSPVRVTYCNVLYTLSTRLPTFFQPVLLFLVTSGEISGDAMMRQISCLHQLITLHKRTIPVQCPWKGSYPCAKILSYGSLPLCLISSIFLPKRVK